MDFHSLLRRDLQFLCKRNKIPANMTNVAMADALKSLEFVEGLDEYMNQSDPNALQSPTSVAKQPSKTATRTTRGKTITKAEPQSSSQVVSRSCRLTSKSLAEEMDKENLFKNVAHEQKTNNVKLEANVPKTPAARSTRKASVATSCSSKFQESKKDELVQSVYNTRRSTRLLEKCMADLSFWTKETLDNKPAKNEETEQKVSAQGKNPAGSEPEVILSRDLSDSMEQVWDNLKNDNDQVVGGDIAVMDANTETNKEEMNEVTDDETESENGLVQVDKLEETLQAISEEGPKKNDNDQEIGGLEIHVDLGDIHVLEYASTEAHSENKGESQNVLAFDSLVQVDQQETEETIQENDSELVKMNNYDEDNKTETVAGDSDGTISEADSNQAVQGSDIADEEMVLSESEGSVAAPTSPPLLEETKVKTTTLSPFAAEETIQENDSALVKMNNYDEDNKTEADSNQAVSGSDITDEEMILSESEGSVAAPTSPPLLDETKDKTTPLSPSAAELISEADSNQAVLGSDIADEKMILPESEGSVAAPTSLPLLEETKVKTTPLSQFAAESISAQFPRPSKSTTPLKNSAMKLDNVENKENNMEMMTMMNVNKNENEERIGEEAKKMKKKVTKIDEKELKDASMRQLVKMVKELSIKSSHRTALQILPDNNQTAE